MQANCKRRAESPRDVQLKKDETALSLPVLLSIKSFISCRFIRSVSLAPKSGSFLLGLCSEFSSSKPSIYKTEQSKKSESFIRFLVHGKFAHDGDSQ